MTRLKKLSATSLQAQLVDALVKMQAIPGMKKPLQPSINALSDPSRSHIPNDDLKNLLLFKELILKLHADKIKTPKDQDNAKALFELGQEMKTMTSKKRK